MANATTTVNLPDNTWTEVADAGENAVVTPEKVNCRFLIRYAASAPGAGVTDGHIFDKTASNANVLVGTANTEKTFMRPVNAGGAVDVHVTVL